MALYFFHVRDGSTFIRDEEGVDLPDLDAVRWEAEQGARGFRKAPADAGPAERLCFEVTDEHGTVVLVYPDSGED